MADAGAPPAPSRVAWDDAGVWLRSGFAAFLEAHGIQRYDLIARSENGAVHVERRFFRVKRTSGDSEGDTPLTDEQVVARVTQSLPQDASGTCERVAWVPGFFSLPATTRLASLDLYERGEIYGIDISSGYAVTLLDVQPDDHVLDLCCAPGAKLTMIADTLRMHGSVTGVDFSRPRIGACRQLVHKYRLLEGAANGSWRCRLFHADGRTFSVGPTSDWDPHAFEVVLDSDEVRARDAKSQSRKRKNKSARAREAKRLKEITAPSEGKSVEESTSATTEMTPALYDKVLVDAECTHDGSIKHLQKLQTEEAWHAYVRDHLNDAEIKRILALQQALIANGFALLREGGTMIYSTCSLSIQQNEDIVRRFLETNADAHVVPIDTTGIPCEPGKLIGTVRFTPAHHTSGLFIAKIRKNVKPVE